MENNLEKSAKEILELEIKKANIFSDKIKNELDKCIQLNSSRLFILSNCISWFIVNEILENEMDKNRTLDIIDSYANAISDNIKIKCKKILCSQNNLGKNSS